MQKVVGEFFNNTHNHSLLDNEYFIEGVCVCVSIYIYIYIYIYIGGLF